MLYDVVNSAPLYDKAFDSITVPPTEDLTATTTLFVFSNFTLLPDKST